MGYTRLYLYFSHSSSFCCNPSCNHMRFLRVICGGHRRFVDSTGIRLSFFTTYPFPQACRRAWRCKPSFAVANAAVSATSVVPICYYKTWWIWATYSYVSHLSKLSFCWIIPSQETTSHGLTHLTWFQCEHHDIISYPDVFVLCEQWWRHIAANFKSKLS